MNPTERIEALEQGIDGLLAMIQAQTRLAAIQNDRIAALEASATRAEGLNRETGELIEDAREGFQGMASALHAVQSLCVARGTFTPEEFNRRRLQSVAELDQAGAAIQDRS